MYSHRVFTDLVIGPLKFWWRNVDGWTRHGECKTASNLLDKRLDSFAVIVIALGLPNLDKEVRAISGQAIAL